MELPLWIDPPAKTLIQNDGFEFCVDHAKQHDHVFMGEYPQRPATVHFTCQARQARLRLR